MAVKIYKNEFRKSTVRHALAQLYKGESMSLIGIPGVGKSNTTYWLNEYTSKKDSPVLMISLDLKNLIKVSEVEFYRFLLLELYDTIIEKIHKKKTLEYIERLYKDNISTGDSLLTYNSIKKIISKVLLTTDHNIVLLFDGMEKIVDLHYSVFNTLSAIRDLNKVRVAFVFMSNRDITAVFSPDKAGNLYDLLVYNTHWLKPLERNESDLIAEEFTQMLKLKINQEIKDKIWKVGKGHAWYIKDLVKMYVENEIDLNTPIEVLAKDKSIISRSQLIWMSLPVNYQESLKEIIQEEDPSNSISIPNFLTKSGVVREEKNKISIFSPLFKRFIELTLSGKDIINGNNNEHSNKSKSHKGLRLDMKKRTIIKNGKAIDETLSKSEYKLMKFFFQNESLAVTRDEVAHAIWEDKAEEKYSDWAIDKIISRIRDKIEIDSRNPKYLVTLRGVGYKFTSR